MERDNLKKMGTGIQLKEINENFNLDLASCSKVLELGTGRGDWTRYLKSICNGIITTIDIDCQAKGNTDKVKFICHDVNDEDLLKKLDHNYDCILSDLAVNINVYHNIENTIRAKFCIRVLTIAKDVLKKGGNLVCRGYEGEKLDEAIEILKKKFKKIELFKTSLLKPEEIYVICLDFK